MFLVVKSTKIRWENGKHHTFISLIFLLLLTLLILFDSVCLIGLDARGFLIGPLIAHEIGKSFVPVRKAGKLPGKTISKKSTKEYGEV